MWERLRFLWAMHDSSKIVNDKDSRKLNKGDLQQNEVKRAPQEIIGKLDPLVVPRIRLMGLMFKKIN